MADKFRLVGMPVPPPSNNQYIPIIMRGPRPMARLVPSTELKAYQRAMTEWAKEHFLIIGKARQVTNDWLLKGNMLNVSCFFFFHSSRIYTQNLDVRRFDISNRLKAVEDAISEQIGIDDKHNFRISGEKCETTKPEAYVNVLLSPWRPRGFQDVKDGEEL